jgi:hypothetical protein
MSQQRDVFSEVILWETPVIVRIGDGMPETIDGPKEALDQLSNRWPAERGPKFEVAKTACRLAIQRYGSLNEAREAFIAAAIEVDILG